MKYKHKSYLNKQTKKPVINPVIKLELNLNVNLRIQVDQVFELLVNILFLSLFSSFNGEITSYINYVSRMQFTQLKKEFLNC